MTTNYPPNPGDTVTSNSTGYPPYAHLDDAELLSKYAWWGKQLELVQEQRGHFEQEIMKRCAERGATGIPDETFECELVTTFTYDQPTLTPLLEMLNDVELAKCYEPAYTPEPVEIPAKWKIQQLLAVARRRGSDTLRMVEKAKIQTGRRLRFERRT